MQKLLLLLISACTLLSHAQPAPPYYNVENLRSDTFNILKYTISLEIGNTGSPQIAGNTVVRFTPLKNNQSFIRLDLLKLTVDSVKEGSAKLTYTYNDTLLKVNFAITKNISDTSSVTVFYRGAPVMDQTGWGGFYFNNTQGAQYAWNLGVGFGANPHNYGRVWFPCFDNFVERSKYEYHITTDSVRKAYCSGDLVSEFLNGPNRVSHWKLDQEIPTYLASVAVAKYTHVKWTANTLSGPKPVLIAAHANDTNALKVAFVNLLNCITGFENYFGPYRWNRVGYALVPFSGGAMEHAANIAYPRTATGNLNYEELMSHELSHHWWGNLVTCETPEDMWINEGMASLSADLFFEWQYGKEKYLERIRTRHEDLLHFLHKRENGFRSISGNGHDLTYSDHVYKKGADAGHTLRGYMGDNAFFAACKYVMQQKQFTDINSNELRDLMATSSGQNLNDFFNDWIYSGGWPHFSIDSVGYIPQGNNFVATVSLKQKLYGRTALHNNVPLELSFFKADKTRTVAALVMSGAQGTYSFSLPYEPKYCALNYDSKISDATSADIKRIRTTGIHTYTLGKSAVDVVAAGIDTTLLRIVHNYVRPDPFKSNTGGHILSDQHYWRVEGIPAPGFHAKLRFIYDGTKGSSGSTTYLDTMLTRNGGDSIALFFRKDAGEDWQWVRKSSKIIYGSSLGLIEDDSLKFGEYTFANLGDTSTVGLKRNTKVVSLVKLFPNPATHQVTVEIGQIAEGPFDLLITDVQGRVVMKKQIKTGKTLLDLSSLSKGSYQAEVKSEQQSLYRGKLILN